MRSSFVARSLMALSLAALQPAAADDALPSFEKASEQLQAATVTVRVAAPPADAAKPDSNGASSEPTVPRVTVFSGVSLGGGLLVAPLFASSDSRIRITLPGGDQAEARARVLDEYSGLALLEMDKRDVPGVELCETPPKVGSWVISAAAWGVEKPVVSLGIVSGVDRSIPGANYPPLLQCDLRTAETSSGAGLVNPQGQLLGIVIAADTADQRRGWTYAVPVKHVQRLLRARAEHPADAKAENVVVLKRRRPVVGMVLEGDAEEVIVSRVEKGSPAEKAGIQVGDQILAADGVKIRAVYQAVTPLLGKQPGDTVVYLVQQQDALRTIEIILGGGFVLPAAPGTDLSHLFQPKIVIDGLATTRGPTRAGQGNVRELFAPDSNPELKPDAANTEQSLTEQIKLLQAALDSYRQVIAFQKGQLDRRTEDQANAQKHISDLEAEIQSLQKKLAAPAGR
jgi:serine protease Do